MWRPRSRVRPTVVSHQFRTIGAATALRLCRCMPPAGRTGRGRQVDPAVLLRNLRWIVWPCDTERIAENGDGGEESRSAPPAVVKSLYGSPDRRVPPGAGG